MRFLRVAYEPLFRHLDSCPYCSKEPGMCSVAIRLVYACRLIAADLNKPIPQIPVLS